MNYGDDQLGGRNVTGEHFTYQGDYDLAFQHLPIARNLLGGLKENMFFNRITSNNIKRTLRNGVVIFCSSIMVPGQADIDRINIDTTGYKEEKGEKMIVLGYVIYSQIGVWAKLPNGQLAGHFSYDRPNSTYVAEAYQDNPDLQYNGYPDFGGCKRYKLNEKDSTFTATNNISQEFEIMVYKDYTDTKEMTTSDLPPGETDWHDIYADWIDYDSPRFVSQGPFYEDGMAPDSGFGQIVRRQDGAGAWWNGGWQSTTTGMKFLYNELPYWPTSSLPNYESFGYDVLYMLPGSFTAEYSENGIPVDEAYWGFTNAYNDEFQYAADTTTYPEAWIPDTDPYGEYGNPWYPWEPNPEWPGPFLDTIVHKWDVVETEVVNSVWPKITVPMNVPAGPHQIGRHTTTIGQAIPFNFEAYVHTDKGIYKFLIDKTVTSTTVNQDLIALTINVGMEGKLEELVY